MCLASSPTARAQPVNESAYGYLYVCNSTNTARKHPLGAPGVCECILLHSIQARRMHPGLTVIKTRSIDSASILSHSWHCWTRRTLPGKSPSGCSRPQHRSKRPNGATNVFSLRGPCGRETLPVQAMACNKLCLLPTWPDPSGQCRRSRDRRRGMPCDAAGCPHPYQLLDPLLKGRPWE